MSCFVLYTFTPALKENNLQSREQILFIMSSVDTVVLTDLLSCKFIHQLSSQMKMGIYKKFE